MDLIILHLSIHAWKINNNFTVKMAKQLQMIVVIVVFVAYILLMLTIETDNQKSNIGFLIVYKSKGKCKRNNHNEYNIYNFNS